MFRRESKDEDDWEIALDFTSPMNHMHRHLYVHRFSIIPADGTNKEPPAWWLATDCNRRLHPKTQGKEGKERGSSDIKTTPLCTTANASSSARLGMDYMRELLAWELAGEAAPHMS